MRANIINQEEIGPFLRSLADGREPLASYLELGLRKAMMSESGFFRSVAHYPANPPTWLSPEKFVAGEYVVFDAALTKTHTDKLHHIKDWIVGAITSQDAWLQDVDEKGRPKKLMQIGSIERAYAMAEKDMRWKANRLRSQFLNSASLFEEDETAGHSKTIKIYDDGFRIVRLFSAHALDVETAQLGHCIGNGGYDENLAVASHEYYSLRDPLNRAHVTFEVVAGVLEQFKGKENAPPVEIYMGKLQDFIRERGWRLSEYPAYTGLLYKRGIYYDASNLPAGFEWDEDLYLLGAGWLTVLPDNMLVRGDLNLSGCTGLTFLPENLSVGGDLDISGCTGLTFLPDSLSIGGALNLSGCTGLTSLPENLSVRGDLNLSGCTGLKSLPENLSVGGALYLARCTGLASLPENLSVRGTLDISGCTGLTSLPKSLLVGGSIIWGGKSYDTVDSFRAAFEERHPPKKESEFLPSTGAVPAAALSLVV